MNNISLSSFDIHYLSELSKRDIFINKIHPLIKLIITIFYCMVVISFEKYDITGMLPLIIYPVVVFIISDIDFFSVAKKLIVVLPIILGIGIFNPIYDKDFYVQVLGITLNSGWISFLTLILKGILTVFASFLLIATTSIEKICFALRLIKVPKIFVNQILLMYRYIFVLLRESSNIYNAYILRSPKSKGVNYKVWGSLLGQMLLRSYDRAINLYESMLLRGYNGEFSFRNNIKLGNKDIIYAVIWFLIIVFIRIVNIPLLIEAAFL